MVKGQWYEFITHWKFSSSASVGLVEHWMKGPGSGTFVKQTFLNGSQTMHMSTLSGTGASSNLRMGLYRNKSFSTTDTVYYDNAYMGDVACLDGWLRSRSTVRGARRHRPPCRLRPTRRANALRQLLGEAATNSDPTRRFV